MSGQPTGSDWVEEFIQGNTRVHGQVFDHFFYTMSFFAFKIIHNQPVAEEIASDCIHKMIEMHEKFESLSHLRSFLYRCVKNKCFDHLRRPSSKIRNSDAQLYEHLPAQEEDSVIHLLIQAEVMEMIYQQIEKLPEKRREILKLFYVEGFTLEEISIRLGLDLATVRSAKSKAIAQLRTILGDKKLLSVLALLLARQGVTTN